MTEYIEREEKCGDCIHVEVCERNPIFTEFSRENPAYCKNFMKAADVVEVVRCEDCKYSNDSIVQFTVLQTYNCMEGTHDHQTLLKSNDFCSRGERRERECD